MATTITDLLCNNFGGIRRKNARFDSEKITCSNCQNVELYDTGINSGVGIRSSKGNIDTGFPLLNTEKIIGIFESIQSGITYFLVYVEDSTSGALYRYNPATNVKVLLKGSLAKTGKCSGTDFEHGADETDVDVFVFTNGTNMFYVDIDAQTPVVDITSNDVDGHPIRGLGLKVYNNRLWVFHDNKLYSSYQSSCTDWATHSASDDNSAFGMDFTKNITAIAPYLGSLAIFFADSSCLLTGSTPSTYSATDESPGGCAGYDSLVFHGTELWFYDNTKKGVFSFQQVVNGDKTLGENVAIDIQEELMSIDNDRLNEIKTLSVVQEDRNEIWFILPTHYTLHSTIMIFDYSHGEWLKRICPTINCIGTVNGNIYSGGSKLCKEYEGDTFAGEYIPHEYTCSILNFGIDNALKIFYFPPRATLDSVNCINNFYVRYIRNYDYSKNKKEKFIKGKGLKRTLHYDSEESYDSKFIYPPKKFSSIAKFPSSTFKTLEIQIYTKDELIDGLYEEFSIENLECTKVKIKQI